MMVQVKFFVGSANQLIRCSNQFSQKIRNFDVKHTKATDFLDEEIDRFIISYEEGRKMLYADLESLNDKKNYSSAN